MFKVLIEVIHHFFHVSYSGDHYALYLYSEIRYTHKCHSSLNAIQDNSLTT